MSHHSDQPLPKEASELVEKLAAEAPGPTGKFPDGKLNENDKGELTLTIGQKNGKVIVDFGISVAWIGFTPDQAFSIALALAEKAAEAKASAIVVVPG